MKHLMKVLLILSVTLLPSISYSERPLSLREIQKLVDKGDIVNHPGLVRVVGGEKIVPQYPYILGASLKPGTVAPIVVNPKDLLEEAKKKQVVKVTDLSKYIEYCYPVYKEIARQNGMSCVRLMEHLDTRWEDDEFDPKFDVQMFVAVILEELC